VRILLAFICYLSFVGGAFAFGGGGGGDGGCCGFPEELVEEAKLLRNGFEKLSFQELQDQQILETLCENNNCGNLSESQASRLLDRALGYQKEQSEAQDRWEAKWATRVGVLFTFFGLLIAWFAYRQSRDADRRSVRNQVEIEHLVEASTESRSLP